MIVNKNCFLQTNWFGEILLQFWSHPVETNQSCAVYWYFVKRLLKNMINFQSLLILYSYISVHIRTKATFTRGKGARQLGNKKLALINGNVSAIFVLISLFWSFFLLWCRKEWMTKKLLIGTNKETRPFWIVNRRVKSIATVVLLSKVAWVLCWQETKVWHVEF